MTFYSYRRIPYGALQIGKGIRMSWLENHISITAKLEVSGKDATAELASRMKQTIELAWNAIFDDSYIITCRVDMLFRRGSTEDSTRNQIYVLNKNEITATFAYPLYNSYINYYLTDARLEWTPAHEFGHMLGFADRYMEDYSRIIRHTNNISRSTSAERGWEGNIMSTFWGVVEKKNIQALFAMYATEPTILRKSSSEDFWEQLGKPGSLLNTTILQTFNL